MKVIFETEGRMMDLEQIISVKMKPEKSILKKNFSNKETAKTIADHLIMSRRVEQPNWRPYIVQDGLRQIGHSLIFEGKKFYPESVDGDVVYVAGNIWMEKDYEIWINVIGRVQVYLEGECLFSSWEEAEKSVIENKFMSFPVKLKADKLHRLVIKTVCAEGQFGFRLNISPPRCAGLWANFYLVLARILFPQEVSDTKGSLAKEEGMAVSPLYTGVTTPKEAYYRQYEFEKCPVYVFPKICEEEKVIDFYNLYKKGNIAYAYTTAEKNGHVVIRAASKMKILVNGLCKTLLVRGEEAHIDLLEGDEILIKSKSERDGWGFTLTDAYGIALPMLDTNRVQSFHIALCGPFYQEGFQVKLPPEYATNILQPFPDGRGGQVFWRFQHAYLRAYLDSSFFGQWYYASMLSFNGIRCCGETFDEPKYTQYFLNNEQFLADWSEYATYDCNTFEFSSFMYSFTSGEYLDHIGTMGVNFIEAYRMTGDTRYLNLIRLLQGRIKQMVPRFEDGTFRRNFRKTMWADDFYMSGPFLAKLYSQMGDEESLADILCQMKGFVKRLYMPEKNIFSHIYFWETDEKNQVPWGRGNGWIAFSLSELLMCIPETNPAHEQIKQFFYDFCEGVAALQDECGLWHQVLDRPESYLETSCTAMFTLAFYRGLRYKWLPSTFQMYADRGLQAILQHCVDEEGIVYGVCMGSSCSMDVQYYFDLPTIKDDNHGTGVVLMLLCEAEMMKWEEH